MTSCSPLSCSAAISALACVFFSTAVLAQSAEATGPVISLSEPVGFADLTEDRTLLVDVYFGGSLRGEAMVEVTPDSVRFLDVGELLALLPGLADRKAVEAELAGQGLPPNADRLCTPSVDQRFCGRLAPEQVGIIFDRERFRIDIFLNPRLLEVQDDLESLYLPPANDGLSLINSIGGVLSGGANGGRDYYNLHDQLALTWGERRIRADMSYASEGGLGAERLAFEWDRPERRYLAGALWAPGNGVSGQRKLIGIGLETQIDTRRDRDAILGSPVIVFLDRRARVEVVREGRVLGSAIYEAGNQKLETSNLPEGSYEILLRIQEAGRPAREERRFYTKSRRIPSDGRTDFFVYGGLLVDRHRAGSLKPSNNPYLQGGIARRLGADWAVDGTLQASDELASAELGTTFLTPAAQLRAALILDTTGGYGTILQLTSTGGSQLNFNVDFRQINNGNRGLGGSLLASPFNTGGGEEFDLSHPLQAAQYSQLGGIVSYSLANMRFLGTFFYRDDKDQRAHYSVGPSFEWDILRKESFLLTLRGDLTATDRGSSGFAGISLRLLNKSSTMTALVGQRSSTRTDHDLGDGLVTAVSGAWNVAAAGGELAMGGGYEHQPRQDDLVLSSELRHSVGTLSGNFVRSENDTGATTQYAAGFQTTLAAGAGALRVAGRTTTESMILTRVIGAREADQFEVLVNDQVAGKIEGKDSVAIALPAYRAYQVRIRPTGKDLLSYDGSTREVGLYPGAVTKLEWTAAPMTIKLGRLIDPDGQPIAGASITGKGVWGQTDDQGYFQIEVPDDAEVRVRLRSGQTFAIQFPSAVADEGFAQVGQIVCCRAPEFRAGARDLTHSSFDGEAR